MPERCPELEMPDYQRSDETNFYGHVLWMEGSTDPESPYQGRPVRLEAVTTAPGGGVELGTAIGRFAQWHFGGRQPANLLSTITVTKIGHGWRGRAEVTFSDGTTRTCDRPETFYRVTLR